MLNKTGQGFLLKESERSLIFLMRRAAVSHLEIFPDVTTKGKSPTSAAGLKPQCSLSFNTSRLVCLNLIHEKGEKHFTHGTKEENSVL